MTENETRCSEAYMTAMNALSELFDLGAATRTDRERIEHAAHEIAAGRLSLIAEAEYTGGRDAHLMFSVQDMEGNREKLFGFYPRNPMDS